MDQVFPRLYLGNFEDAEQVSRDECPCIMTLCERAPTLCDAGFAHIHAPIPDETYLKPHVWNERVCALTRAVRDEPAVLVHCRLGVSRSPTLLAAYLTCCGWTLESALALLVLVRPQVRPHAETWRSMCDWHTR